MAPAAAQGPPPGVRFALAGDVHGEGHLFGRLQRGENPLSEVRAVLSGADIAAVNLETPVGPPGTPAPGKKYVFRAPRELHDRLLDSGVDVVSLANNHSLDQGVSGLFATIDHARAKGLQTVGAGRNAAGAFAPAMFDVRGTTVAVLGFSRVVPAGWAATATRPGVASLYDRRAALEAVRAARARAAIVVVLVHWGTELAPCPDETIVALGRELRGAGATIVAGHHTHRVQRMDADRTGVTAYSLGNFVWYHRRSPSDRSGILTVEVPPGAPVRSSFHPAVIGGDGRPRLTGGPPVAPGGPCR